MSKVLVVYFSKSGNTKKMAEYVKEGAALAGADAGLKDVSETSAEDLLEADGIIIGSPTYYGLPAAPIKELLDESVKFHGKLEGRAGGAFSSAANVGGGNETAIMAILQAMLIHGMVIQGTPRGDHYGPVSIASPDERVRKGCLELGERVARLSAKMS